MKTLTTRREIAEFLAQVQWADFSLKPDREDGACLIIRSGQGQSLCRYKSDEFHCDDEAGRLERIITRLNRIKAAAADILLRPSAEDAKLFQEAVRRAWAGKLKAKDKIGARDGVYAAPNLPRWSVAIDGPKMKPCSVLDKAAKLGVGSELALTLFARIVKAGIMPLALITYGAKDYDLRYRADFDKLDSFLNMSEGELLSLLAPANEGEDLRADGDNSPDKELPDEDSALPAQALPIKNPDWDFYDSKRDSPANDKRADIVSGFCEDGAPPLVPAPEKPDCGESLLLSGDDSDDEIFAEPSAHKLGTLKHKAVADKLCNNLSVVWPFGNAGTIYKFNNPISFADSEEFAWGKFGEDEISYLNQALSDLQKATSILVEYRLPSKQEGSDSAKRIDVVAYYADTKTLKIIDWKFGRNPVGIDNNLQLNGYVQRLLADFIGADNGDKVKWIEISIVQPNSYVGETKRRFLNKNGCLA